MAYLFDEFKNIRTFPARTRVYRDGVLVPELSSDEDSNLPLHIIHIGNITGVQNWFVDMNDSEKVFFTARVAATGATNIRMEINANLPGLEFDGKIIIKNSGSLDLSASGNNNRDSTKIKLLTKLFAAAGSENRLTGVANVPAETSDIETDISFAALLEDGVKTLVISPAQRISGVPKGAGHSASIYNPAPAQIQYLSAAGLSPAESAELLNRAFMEEA
jgi:Fe-S cluster assembly scaffold protein SufB